MKQFELKFTPENLYRHLTYDPMVITTIRKEVKGEIGDVTIVNNSGIYQVISCRPIFMRDLSRPENVLWKNEGFPSQREYVAEIKRIYGNCPDMKLCVMVLYRLMMMLIPTD